MTHMTLKWDLALSLIMLSVTIGLVSGGKAFASSVDDRLNQLERHVDTIRDQMKETHESEIDHLKDRVERLERQQPPSQGGETGNMVFFRGGGAFATSDRSNEVFSDVLTGAATGDTGYYVGAGLDLVLSKDLWGMLSNTWALGEISVEYKSYKAKTAGKSAIAAATNPTPAPTDEVEITQLTVSVSPKIMFMEGSRFRPWIIPVGLDFHVISPPSNETTVLDIGGQFAVGIQYRVWRAIHLGLDGRYHLAAGQTDTDNSFGTTGAYVGIAF